MSEWKNEASSPAVFTLGRNMISRITNETCELTSQKLVQSGLPPFCALGWGRDGNSKLLTTFARLVHDSNYSVSLCGDI